MAISSIDTFKKYERDGVKLEARFKDSPDVKREVEYFKSAVGKLKSVDDLFKDRRLLAFLASASNLAGEEQYPGKMKRILTESVDNKDAVMYRLTDKRYSQAAESFRFDQGLSKIKSAQDDIIAAYQKSQYEASVGNENAAVREARHFENYAGNVKTVWEILGDPILRKVVTKTLGIPEQIAFQPLDTQAKAVTDRLDISKLSDANFRDKFIKRFLTQSDMEQWQAGGSASTDWRLSLFGGGTLVNLIA
ncbi:MAG TPA: DUF1217 domain-containing protein [Azospirillum sp.]|nr:DUF1217 domain-containing protein [Azospirillum sp.]